MENLKNTKRFIYILLLFCIISIYSIIISTTNAASFSFKRKSINVYDTFDLKSIINESNNITSYSSSDNSIVSVNNNGIITGNKMGQATIYATDNTGNTINCLVSVGFFTGIDISTFNNNVNWDKVKKEGIDFVMIRSSYGWYDQYDAAAGKEYNFQYDAQLYNNIKGASDYGIPFGIYHYSYAQNTTQAALEAEYTINALRSTGNYANNISLPVAYDVEDSSWQGSLDKNTLTDIVITYCTKIKEAGYSPMIYANKNWFINHLDIDRLNALGYDFWYALWPNNPNFINQIKIGDTGIVPLIWQYTSDGYLDGANTNSGRLDMNIMYMKERVKIDFINDGIALTSKIIDKDGNISNLPTVSKSGYYFKGWQDQNGNIVSTSTLFSSNTTLTAIYEKIIPLENISLNITSNYLLKGNTLNLQVSYTPENTNVDKNIIWESSDNSIATVDNGNVLGISRGDVTITAKSKYNEQIIAKAKITIYEELQGDISNDGTVDITDAYLLLRSIVNSNDLELPAENLPNGDFNEDNIINITDAYYLLRFIVKNM